MPQSARFSSCALVCFIALSLAGCATGPSYQLRQSQLTAYQLHHQNRTLSAELEQKSQLADVLASRDQHQRQTISDLRNNLELTQKRLENLTAERSKIQDRVVGLLNQARDQANPLPQGTAEQFERLADQFPGFEFVPETGMGRFRTDILFASGRAEISPKGLQILKAFAEIINSEPARKFNISIAGHTDDERIIKPHTRQMHPTNWHLSTNRANSVILALSKYGVSQDRMVAEGHSKFRPITTNGDETSRRLNRRVEIYVYAPDQDVASTESAGERE